MTTSRLFFVDHWRAAIIILVVLHHIAVIYGANTPFYYLEPHDTLATIVLVIFQLLNQAWFMGALFLISGYFTPASFDRKGTAAFLKDRLLRLSIPLLLFFFVFNPLVSIYGINAMPTSLTHLAAPLTWADYPHLVGVGPLWFVEMLLIFDFGYALWRFVTRKRIQNLSVPAPPRLITIVVFVLSLALVSYLIRIPLPLGKYVGRFPSLAYLPQYLSFFILGTIAGRANWFPNIPGRTGKWGFIAVLVATFTLFPIAFTGLGKGLSGGFIGNGQWPSAVYALWDSILSVGICLALVTFFHRFFSHQTKLGTFLSQQSFMVYIIHIPILVFLAILLRGVMAENLLKFILLAVIAVPLCFGVAYLIRKIPKVSRII
jgi:surface polysaccharide O-acyltransferase-like enzyme